MDSWLKYLDFLQAAIARMAANSFAVKGWSIALGAAIIGLTAKDGSPQLAWFALVPVFAFYYLDAYYLALETRFRELYTRAVADGPPGSAPGQSAAATARLPSLNMTPAPVTRADVRSRVQQPAVRLTHLPIMIVALLVTGFGVIQLGLRHIAAPNADAALSIVRQRWPSPTTILGVNAVELVAGAGPDASREAVWHLRLAIRRPRHGRIEARDYPVDAFVRAADGWQQFIGH